MCSMNLSSLLIFMVTLFDRRVTSHKDFWMEFPTISDSDMYKSGYRNSGNPSIAVIHAGVPRGLAVIPMPLENSDHELAFNVTWESPMGPPVRSYSMEVHSLTETVDCKSNLCYEYNIPGNSSWKMIPEFVSPVAEGCSVRPGCAYRVRLIPHPWDGHTSANLDVKLDECVAGVCSCAHARRLPKPTVSAMAVFIKDELYVNVSWSLPIPAEPLRLPPRLRKQSYLVSIGKQMVSDVHPAPWFAHSVSQRTVASGFVVVPEKNLWLLMPVVDRKRGGGKSGDRNTNKSGEKKDSPQRIILDIKLLARVNLVDELGCIGPAGNAVAYDPAVVSKTSIRNYVLYTIFGGTVVLAMALLLVVGASAIKRFLKAFRAPSTAHLQTLNFRPPWLALQLQTNNELPSRGQMEESPLYVHREFEIRDKIEDAWEVSHANVHLGSLIGSGAFGRVHIAQLELPGGETVTVAAKMLTDHPTEEEMQDFLQEIAMLKHVGSHKHVIRLIACCTERAPIIALLEHAPRGDLLTLLRAARGKRNLERQKTKSDEDELPSEADTDYTNWNGSDPTLMEADEKLYTENNKTHTRDHYVAEPALQLDGSTMRDYALQVALGMRHLEERGITHRDLAARNILVDAAGVLKVADFGLSRSGVYVHTRARPVPLRWLAPEAIYHSQYCNASDVWAFAILLWEIATFGGFPYAELSNPQIPQFLTEGGRLPKPARASPRLYNLMLECWSDEPQNRPTFAQIVDKLTAQQQLYVDLDSVLTRDDSFTINEHDMDTTDNQELKD